MKHGKKYIDAAKKYNKQEIYTYQKSIGLVKEISFAKFDETVEISVNLNLKKSQTIRDTIILPNQFSREKKILVFAKGEKVEEAKEAGATYVGDVDFIDKIKGGWMDFDVAVATPDMMKDVGKLGPILGRKGIMPNPKTQTVTFDIKGALKELKKGRVEYRSDKTGIVHFSIGKVSMEEEKLLENITFVIGELEKKKPSDVKGDLIKTITLSSTMGPGVRVDFKNKGSL